MELVAKDIIYTFNTVNLKPIYNVKTNIVDYTFRNVQHKSTYNIAFQTDEFGTTIKFQQMVNTETKQYVFSIFSEPVNVSDLTLSELDDFVEDIVKSKDLGLNFESGCSRTIRYTFLKDDNKTDVKLIFIQSI